MNIIYKTYLGNWLMDIGMAGVFLVGVLSDSKIFMIVMGFVFTIMSFFRTKQEVKR